MLEKIKKKVCITNFSDLFRFKQMTEKRSPTDTCIGELQNKEFLKKL
jgi:hypothetical protein